MLLVEAENRLRWSKYSPAYRHRLLEGATSLRDHLAANGWDWRELRTAKAHLVDQLLVDFVRQQHTRNKKHSLRVSKHAVLFMQAWRPRLRKTLHCTWQTLRAWEEQVPSKFRAPVPLPILAALVCSARERAFLECEGAHREVWLDFATLLMIGFFALLRPCELLSLAVRDVSLPNTFSLGAPFAVLRIQRAKNARQMGPQQFAEVRHPDAINWLVWLVEKRENPSALLWKGNPTKFRLMFRHLTQKLRIESLGLSPASLRAGGATWMLDEKVEVSRIRFSGRWANLGSLEHYLQVARAQQISVTLSSDVTELLKLTLKKHGFMLGLPRFLAAQVPPERLVASVILDFRNASSLSERVRCWGRIAETVQASHHHRWAITWSQVLGHRMGRLEEVS